MKKQILCAEDDKDLQDAINEVLSADYIVTFASDGEEAIQKFSQGNYQAILSDIKMPKKSGVDFLKVVKSKSSVPFILMTGFSELLETQSAYDLGADEFLAKPFKPDDLKRVLDSIFGIGQSAVINKDPEFCKILVSELELGTPAPVDIYFRLSSSKYLKIIKHGNLIDQTRVKGYIARGLDALYVTKNDFARFVGINLDLARQATSKGGDADFESKRNLLNKATESLLQQIYKNGIDDQGFKNAKDLTERNISLIREHQDLESLLVGLNSHSDSLYAHALGVSLYSTIIATALGWSSPITLSRISLAGLFHDIGLKEIDREILDKPRKDLTAAEIREYESHCLRGRDILTSVPGIPSELSSIASQHHENNLGMGFPGKLKRQQIHPIAKIIKVADLFCDLTIKSQYSLPVEPKMAVKKIFDTNLQEIEPIYLAALFSSFDVEMPDELKKVWQNASEHKI